jgi:hypothetical protein
VGLLKLKMLFGADSRNTGSGAFVILPSVFLLVFEQSWTEATPHREQWVFFTSLCRDHRLALSARSMFGYYSFATRRPIFSP